jgi:hypothetical protein
MTLFKLRAVLEPLWLSLCPGGSAPSADGSILRPVIRNENLVYEKQRDFSFQDEKTKRKRARERRRL